MSNNPKLTVLCEKLRGETFELDKEQMSVGRKEGMDICIKDASMSGHHCDLIRTPDGNYILRDNNSTNGTRINNIQVTEQELKNSDIIQFGGVEVIYDRSGDGNGEAAPAGGSKEAVPAESGLKETAPAGVRKEGVPGTSRRAHTPLSLEDISSNLTAARTAVNYSPFAGREREKQKQIRLLMLGIIGVLAVALFAVIVWVVITAVTPGN